MATVSVSIPDEIKARMDELDDINWSSVAKKAFTQKINDYDFFKRISEKSKLTEEDATKLAKLVNKGVSKRVLEMK